MYVIYVGKFEYSLLGKKGHLSQTGKMVRTNISFLTFLTDLLHRENYADLIRVNQYEPGQLLIEQATKSFSVYIIKSGFTKCFFSEDNGRDYIVEFLGEGEIVGEIEAMKNIQCLCSVQTLSAVEAYVIPMDVFQRLLITEPALNRLLLDILADRIIRTSSRASFQQLYTLEYALGRLMMLQKQQRLSISKEDMAAYLGITIRSLNRVLRYQPEKDDKDNLSAL